MRTAHIFVRPFWRVAEMFSGGSEQITADQAMQLHNSALQKFRAAFGPKCTRRDVAALLGGRC